MNKTKIVCTLGPASCSDSVIEDMLKSGMNVARLNFSHGDHESHKKTIETFRRVRDRLGMPAAVMLDTKGPEIRLGLIEGGSAVLSDGQKFTLTARDIVGNENEASVTYKDLPKELSKGASVLIDDGRVGLEVAEVAGDDLICTVRFGGVIKDRKGVNVPNVRLNMDYLSECDKSDLLFGIENDVDFVAASFVRRKEDVIALRRFLDYNGGTRIMIISKIENNEGIENFDAILEQSNGIMVARGDMGVEVAYERLPGIQKRFIKKCYQSGKMVITATQMLESMTTNPDPTRAEITDVANAVFDGTSAVMLSGESAMGKYPVRAVRAMAKIAAQAEKDAFATGAYTDMAYEMDSGDVTNAICDAATTTARDICAKAILTVTNTGYSARRMSKFRPEVPIIAATPDAKSFHQLSLSWGVTPVMARYQRNSDDLFAHAVECAKLTEIVGAGDYVVMTAGIPVGITGNTNTIKVQKVDCDRYL